MKGKSLDDWSGLPGELRPSLEVIALHGVEKNFPVLEKMTGEQFEKSISLIQPAALALYQYWLSVRMSEASSRPVPVKGQKTCPGQMTRVRVAAVKNLRSAVCIDESSCDQ